MTSLQLRQALYAAALLSRRRDLSHRARSVAIANVLESSVGSMPHIIERLAQAFRKEGLELKQSWPPSREQVEAARARAEQWIHRGVFVVPTRIVKAPDMGRHDLPSVLFAKGDPSILDQRAACILNSRKTRRVGPTDPWILATTALFREASTRVRTFVSSYGTLSYALVSSLARLNQASLVLVCEGTLPFMEDPERLADFLDRHESLFPSNQTLLLSPFPPGPLPPASVRWRERDNLVVALSSLVLVAAVREGGTMEEIVREACMRRITIAVRQAGETDRTTAGNLRIVNHRSVARIELISVQARDDPNAQESSVASQSAQRKNTTLCLREWPEQGSHLIHYTRSCPGPWPSQNWGDYCKTLIELREDAAHSGFHTLLRILEERLIRASKRLTRGSVPVVSFTECLPRELEGLMKWRRGLVRWAFEPYGIAVPKDVLVGLGAAPVAYGIEDDFRKVPEDKRYLFQLQKTPGAVWSAEKEWRLRGDLALDPVTIPDLIAIVASVEEAWVVQERFAHTVTLAGIDPGFRTGQRPGRDMRTPVLQ